MNVWKNSTGSQFLLEDIYSVISKHPKAQIHVGCDSHYKSGKLIFAIVIAVYSPGECSRYFFKRSLEPGKNNKKNLASRLLKEVQSSIDVATMIREKFGENLDIYVHADISSNSRNKSNIVHEPAKKWIMAMGFGCYMKPKAWASSSIADLHAK